MRTFTLGITLAACLSGCASRTVSEDVVNAWMQQEDERGRLVTARVASVERVSFRLNRQASSPAPLVVVAGAVAAPYFAALGDTIRDTGYVYRHRLRLSTGEEKVVDLDFAYKIEECLALRTGLSPDSTMPVRALPGECKWRVQKVPRDE